MIEERPVAALAKIAAWRVGLAGADKSLPAPIVPRPLPAPAPAGAA